MDSRPISFDECASWARLEFEKLFNASAKQLLHNFPADMLNASGTPFWAGHKRAPEPLAFDIDDATHLAFIISAANLRANVYGLKVLIYVSWYHINPFLNAQGNTDPSYFRAFIPTVDVPPFVPKSGIRIATDDKDLKENGEGKVDMDVDGEANGILAQIPSPSSLAGYRLKPLEFEKDDDTNFHMDFIVACSNLRARNYQVNLKVLLSLFPHIFFRFQKLIDTSRN